MKLNLEKIAHLNKHIKSIKLDTSSNISKGDANKIYILNTLLEFCGDKYNVIQEYKFSDRKFRFDYFIPELKVAIEYEGIYATKSRHTTKSGYTKDTQKYNIAAINNIRVLRYTANTYINLLHDLNLILINIIA